MIQQSPFPPIFTLERVTPAVEAARAIYSLTPQGEKWLTQ